MQWIKEVETAKSIDELMTSRSIVERTDFPDYDMLDAMIASALKKLLDKDVHFRRRGSVKEQRAQKYDQFLRGRQIAYMIYEHFQATGAYEADRICSVYACRMTMSKISTYDGTKHYCQQVKHLQKWYWTVYTCHHCTILFSFRLCWLCTTKKRYETMYNRTIPD